MPNYYSIDATKPGEKRIVEGLLRLKDGFTEAALPRRTIEETLVLATWNIREFESGKYGARGKEPLFYLAEVINNFDLVAVQEVRDDISSLNTLMRYLGGWWKVLLTDVTEGTQGNRERMAFLYDTRKITFGGLAGEVVIPAVKRKGQELDPARQLARTPFMVGFRAGWFKFTICTTHIFYGEETAEDPRRVEEIKVLGQFLAKQTQSQYAWSQNMILLGDFNIFDTSDQTMQGITGAGFVVPKQIQSLPSNAPRTKHYDQIAFIAPEIQDQLELCKAGVFNFFDYVYRPADEAAYAAEMGDDYAKNKDGKRRDKKSCTTYYNQWRTFQMSDHLPMWIELKIDFSREYLNRKFTRGIGPEKAADTHALNMSLLNM